MNVRNAQSVRRLKARAIESKMRYLTEAAQLKRRIAQQKARTAQSGKKRLGHNARPLLP